MANLYLCFLLLLTTSCSVARANICSTFNANLENDATDNHSPKTNSPPIYCCEAASKGECNDNLERYFHDPIAGNCKRFIYSGCGGNSNRYSTKEDCEAACRDPCTLPVSTISCNESDFYYNQTIDACLQFVTGMCSSSHNGNNNSSSSSHHDHNNSSNSFSSQEQCELRCVKDVCHLQPVPYKIGSNKIYYDSKTGSCKEFNEGCRGNGNCFATVKDCQNKCTTKDAKCTLPKEQGFPCNHTTDANHFYYDAQNKQCKKYSKGKCAATVNNFLTLRQCSWTCEENVCMEGSIPSSCNTSESRYFYNPRTRECEIFPKANCNENSFESKEQCQTKCLLKDICRIPVTPRDSCNGSESRWYFESKTGLCEEISHGGCDRNDNHFLSKASCEKGCSLKACQSPTHPETCGKPQPGYYYDSKSGTCVFSNTVCYDDGNHFLSAELCEQTCIVANPCLAPVKEKSCESTQTRYYYDSQSGQCARFEFKGCGGNANNYESLEECNAMCKDQQEKPTTGIKLSKTVNSTADAVKHGNTSTESVGNNPSRKLVLIDNGQTLDKHANSDFNQTLQNDEPTEDDVYKKADPNQNGYRCLLPLKVGSCDQTSKRFYFDSISQTCRKFTYSGCDGNANNFLTRKQCVRACVAICYDPIETTPCSTIATHYYYNITTGMCEQQSYTGCGGSLNNFKELDTCERICVTDICTQRKKPGPCRGTLPRIYYNAKIGRCLPFTYRGCHQNGNNFLTMEDCQRRCIPLNRCTMAEDANICSVSPRADRFYFDAISGTCQPTNKNPCNSHANSFKSLRQCESHCKPPDPCVSPAKTSCGEAQKFTRFYYNKTKGACEKHLTCALGGFESLSSCDMKCPVNICILPSEHGPCDLDHVRYYYSPESKKCRPFIYGGCKGNKNNFVTFKECVSKCQLETCNQPNKTGSCGQRFERYFYDSNTNSCLPFIYTGCEGNSNNFQTLKACQNFCGQQNCQQFPNKSMTCNVCHLKPEAKDCAHLSGRLHFYYNSSVGRCQKYEMGKCGTPDGNSFNSLDECEKACDVNVCQLSPVSTHCNATRDANFFYDAETDACKSFDKGFCGANLNGFSDVLQCERKCVRNICFMSKDTGPCKEHQKRVFYNRLTGDCEPFYYGGCKGNENNFFTIQDCEKICVKDPCKLPKEAGLCQAYIPRYYYNSKIGECQKFIYGGCGGNENRFETIEACEKTCQPDPCSLPPDTGHCEAIFHRFFYDIGMGTCREFIYGGCGGNENRFETIEACEKKCKPDPCSLPYDMGPCIAIHHRFYYDTTLGKCTEFTYGGCRGNKNNFKTIRDCQQMCIKDPCKQPRIIGPCKAKMERFYFNPNAGQCESFYYGGCEANENNFFRKLDCERRCVKDPCKLSKETGPCEAYMPHYYYNWKTGKCEQFIYGGCDGNENRFETIEACEKKCRPDPCNLLPDVGPCEAIFHRFYYDATLGKCRKFIYGGCDGNRNNFKTIDACKKTCIKDPCEQPPKVGPCEAKIQRFYFNPIDGQCESFYYGGCEANKNNFVTRQDCEKRCVKDPCKLSKDTGPCEAYMPQYYYNSNTNECEQFIYGGCYGNENRFETLEACQKKCNPDPCSLSPDTGPCEAINHRFYYDSTVGKCLKFIYGGCKGNKNNFKTIQDCQQTCIKEPCEEPKKVGLCKAKMQRFYFNSMSGQCESFYYGGCKANRNNFFTIHDCEKRCVKDPCKLSKETGVCLEYFRNYYYNSKTGQCEQFTYGGCGGNENRFETIEACEKKCRPDPCSLPSDVGPCEAHHLRFYYNTTLGECTDFIYGGCEGNKNNFKSIRDCQQMCVKDPCEQPRKVGPCKAKMERFGFNPLSGECESFYYGGCDANENNFFTKQDCEKRCVKDPCKLSKETGPCKAKMPHYYYNSNTSQCEQFIYGGCGGNENRFVTIEACQEKCQPGPCELPPDVGPCLASHPRFYYNTTLGKCTEFIYGGCKGNKNNFKTIRDCQQMCIKDPCEQPRKVGPCKEKMKRFYFNSAIDKCESFYYGGCDANRNNFQTIDECQKQCARDPCSLRPDAGSCHNNSARFYFDLDTGSCLRFTYTGCGGNANRFVSVEQCEQTCIHNRCEKEMDPGVCDKNLTRFFYDSKRDQCVPFLYGGCRGNSNNFKSAKLCRDTCLSKSPCLQPLVPGPCLGLFLRYYYDSDQKTCLEFTYGGCHGNKNNFETLSDCLHRCANSGSKRSDKCHLPSDRGHCYTPEERFYYNHTLESCEPFTYNGCAGNANNFLSEGHCDRECKFNPCRQPKIVGNCSGREKRWFFDETSQLCRAFNYSGCGGSDNNFHSIEQCEELCVTPTCRLEMASGSCGQNLPRFYYNWKHGRCYQFNYTGCNGNENRFPSMKKCQETCKVDPCLQPLSFTGHCSERKKYFYNREFGICQAFMFNGCKPNGNIFSSAEECHNSCRHMYEIDLAR